MNDAKTQENKLMTLLRVLRAGQITLPAELRRKVGLKEGDYLEAEVVENRLVLKPVSVVDREKAWEQIRAAQRSVRYVGPEPEPDEDTLMNMVVEEIHTMRRENDEGGPR